MKNNFMEEMQDKRSRDALKAAITDAYGSELELEVRSPSEAAEEARANGGQNAANGDSSAAPVGTSAAQESAMVRAAMAMGARVVAEESPEDDSGSDSEPGA